jgi:hypothetical protein
MVSDLQDYMRRELDKMAGLPSEPEPRDPGGHVERREQARARGESRFMGNPCKRGHDGLRFVNSRSCVHCRHDTEKDPKYLADKALKNRERRKRRNAEKLLKEDRKLFDFVP